VFDENVFPFASLHPNAGRRLTQDILLLPSSNNACTHGDTQFVDHMPLPVIPVVTNPAKDHTPQIAEEDHAFEDDHTGTNLTENDEEMSENSSRSDAAEEDNASSGSEADSLAASIPDGADPGGGILLLPVCMSAIQSSNYVRSSSPMHASHALRLHSASTRIAGLRHGARQPSMRRQHPLCCTGRRLRPRRHLVGPGPRQAILCCMLAAASTPRRIFASTLDLLWLMLL
jgi:hypothetical protein